MPEPNAKSRYEKRRKDLVILGAVLGFLFGLGFPSMPGDPGWWYFTTVFFESPVIYILFHTIAGCMIGLLLTRLIWRNSREVMNSRN